MRSEPYFTGYRVGMDDAKNGRPFDSSYAPAGSELAQGYARGYRAHENQEAVR